MLGGEPTLCLEVCGSAGAARSGVDCCDDEENLEEILFSHDARRPSPSFLPVELLRPRMLGRFSLGFGAALWDEGGVGVVGEAMVVSFSGFATCGGVTCAGFDDLRGMVFCNGGLGLGCRGGAFADGAG